MALPDLTGQNIQDTYRRVLTVGTGGNMFDGTGSLFIPLSASVEITHEESASHAQTADTATSLSGAPDIYVNHITASGNISASGDICGDSIFVNGHNNQWLVLSGSQLRHDVYGPNTGIRNFQDRIIFKVNGQAASHIFTSQSLAIGSNLYTQVEPPSTLTVAGDVYVQTNITASGDISASGDIYAIRAHLSDILLPNDSRIIYNNDDITLPDTGLAVLGNITSSGNISASGIIYGSSIRNIGASELNGPTSVGGGVLDTLNKFLVTGTSTFSSHITASGNVNAGQFWLEGTQFAYPDPTTARVFSIGDSGNSSLTLTNITASGGISSSGDVSAITGSFFSLQGDTSQATGLAVSGYVSATHITASGNISASGNVYGVGIFGVSSLRLHDASGLSRHVISNGSDDLTISIGNPFMTSGVLIADAHLTASGNISASNNIYAKDYFDDGININTLYDLTPQGTITSSAQLPSGIISSSLQDLGNVTSSGTISASGEISAPKLISSNNITAVGTIQGEHLYSTDDIVADGNISASGDVYAANVYTDDIHAGAATTIMFNDGVYAAGFFTAQSTFNTQGTTNLGNGIHDFINIAGNVTASGAISASGNMIAPFFDAKTSGTGYKLSGASVVYVHDGSRVFGNHATSTKISGSSIRLGTTGDSAHVTASGNISSSGTIIANAFTGPLTGTATGLAGSPDITIDDLTLGSGTHKIDSHGSGVLTIQSGSTALMQFAADGATTITGNVTASGNISASGDIIAGASGKVVGAPYVLKHMSKYIGNPSNGRLYYGNSTFGHEHHSFTTFVANPSDLETLTDDHQNNTIIVPFDTRNIELRGQIRVSGYGDNVPVFWLYTGSRENGGTNGNVSQLDLGWAASASRACTTGGVAWNIDITGSAGFSCDAGDQIMFAVQQNGTSGAYKFNWVLSGERE